MLPDYSQPTPKPTKRNDHIACGECGKPVNSYAYEPHGPGCPNDEPVEHSDEF